MPKLTIEEQNNFLQEPGVLLRIAVNRTSGFPLITPIWFIYEDDAVMFTPRERSEWFDCLKQDARISLCIDEDRLPYRKILAEGTAQLLFDTHQDDEWRDRYRRIAKRYVPGEGADAYVNNTIDEPRALYQLKLSDAKVRSWRMPLPGEPQEGIWHQRYYQDPNIKF